MAELTCNRRRREQENTTHFPFSGGKAAARPKAGLVGRMSCSRRIAASAART